MTDSIKEMRNAMRLADFAGIGDIKMLAAKFHLSDRAVEIMRQAGKPLGAGETRYVYEHAGSADLVIKGEFGEQSEFGQVSANKTEANNWKYVRTVPELKPWFCPVVEISPCGGVLVMRKADDYGSGEIPEQLPKLFGDLDPTNSNFGVVDGRFVMIDYGTADIEKYCNGYHGDEATKMVDFEGWWEGADSDSMILGDSRNFNAKPINTRMTDDKEMRDFIELVEFAHRKPKPGNPEFEDWNKILGKDWTSVQQACQSCGALDNLAWTVRDQDWHNICPEKYNTAKREGKTVWVETDPETAKFRGKMSSQSGEDGVLCLRCFDYYAAAIGMDYEITWMAFNGLRQSFEIDLPKGVKITKHDRREMYKNNPELKPEIRHPDHPGDQGWSAAEDGLAKRQVDARKKTTQR